MKAFLSKNCLENLLSKLSLKMDVIAPVFVEGTPVFGSWIGQPLSLDEKPLLPPQEFFLPQRETLFRYVQDCGRYTFLETNARVRVIFGIRPCDLKALEILDKIFGQQPPDHPYFDKRRSTILMALNCTKADKKCFCSALDAGPTCKNPADLQITEITGGYLVETGSPAGILILKDYSSLFKGATESQIFEADQVMLNAENQMHSDVKRNLSQIKDAIEKADWLALGRHCMNCASCTFVCPVCHCFTILDQGVPDGERLRCKDTCLLSGFSRMAGGGNPRKGQNDRMKNWYQDKFEFIPKKIGMIGCVGCGRCDVVCLMQKDRWALEAAK